MQIRAKLPFESIAWVLLPDHLHTIWRLPETDSNFGLRWARIKQLVTRTCLDHSQSTNVSESRTTRREGSIWQRRFWEHTIRDESDLRRHIDYIHYNPVKHGYAAKPADWPYSTFHRFVRNGVYPKDWASSDEGGITNFGE